MPDRSSKPPKRPVDLNKLAFAIVQDATTEPAPETPEEMERRVMREMGRKGGLKGGKARAESMTPEQRSEIAKRAAKARWGK